MDKNMVLLKLSSLPTDKPGNLTLRWRNRSCIELSAQPVGFFKKMNLMSPLPGHHRGFHSRRPGSGDEYFSSVVYRFDSKLLLLAQGRIDEASGGLTLADHSDAALQATDALIDVSKPLGSGLLGKFRICQGSPAHGH